VQPLLHATVFQRRSHGCVAAVGWELNNIPANYTHLEEAEIATAKSLKALRPDMKVGVTRNTAVVTTFWDSAKRVMFDPATKDYCFYAAIDDRANKNGDLTNLAPRRRRRRHLRLNNHEARR